jgi:hypothetical protein
MPRTPRYLIISAYYALKRGGSDYNSICPAFAIAAPATKGNATSPTCARPSEGAEGGAYRPLKDEKIPLLIGPAGNGRVNLIPLVQP